ncbi:MAG: IPT/TIG domain-containing protein [Candidatus Doudnabacteria bacterium]|nr:IPT/TIG domain-containing protein [Candidatus Doudnabacteria bacterium]
MKTRTKYFKRFIHIALSAAMIVLPIAPGFVATVRANSSDTTITSSTYLIGPVTGGPGNIFSITGIPVGTSKVDFKAALSKGQVGQTWDDSNIADPVENDNFLLVTAEDGTTTARYYILTGPVASQATVSIGSNLGTRNVNAGTLGYSIWLSTFQVANEAVVLKTANFLMTDTAPANALTNIKMLVDGSDAGKTATVTAISGSNYAVFDFTSAPISLTTGSHAIEVRADIPESIGAGTHVQFSIQQASDLTITDPQASVNITASGVPNAAGIIYINPGSITLQQDPTFTASPFPGNQSGVTLGQWIMTGYSEDMKVQSLQVVLNYTGTPASVDGFNNLSLYANGSQVGPSLNAQADGNHNTFTYSFSTANLFTILAGTTVTLAVKGDGALYTGAVSAVRADLVAPANAFQGATSSWLSPSSPLTSTGISLTIGTLTDTPVTGITVSAANGTTTVASGGSLQMSATVLPQNASKPAVTWSVTNGSGTATIDFLSGLLTAGSPGTVTVTATANDGSRVIGTETITVTSASALAPTISHINPTTAAEGGTVYVYGTNFDQNSVACISLASSNAPGCGDVDVNLISSTEVSFTVPSVTTLGSYILSVNDGVGGSESNLVPLSITAPVTSAPVVSSISPLTGDTAGGTSVTITGSGFNDATAIYFGNTAATSFATTSDTSITATSPATSSAGTVDITVVSPEGTSAKNDADQFTYVPTVNTLDCSAQYSTNAINIVVITHGWNDNATTLTGWVQTMARSIANRIPPAELASWDVCAFDWHNGADTGSNPATAPNLAVANAGPDGTSLGHALLPGPWSNTGIQVLNKGSQIDLSQTKWATIHFIAHSAGSNVIQKAAESIRENSPSTNLHLTFLSAYDPNEEQLAYGEDPDPNSPGTWWAEQYVDTNGRPILDNAALTLQYAYNFDVTALDPCTSFADNIPNCDGIGGGATPFPYLNEVHFWPEVWYQDSIYNTTNTVLENPFIGSGLQSSLVYKYIDIPTKYGFQLSLESALPLLPTQYSLGTQPQPCVFLPFVTHDCAHQLSSAAPSMTINSTDTGALPITILPGVTNPTLDLSSLVTGGDAATLPGEINATVETPPGAAMTVSIPAGEVITAATPVWNGIFNLPTFTNIFTPPPPDAGDTVSGTSAIEIGLGEIPMELSVPAELTFLEQTGSSVGWSQAGVYHEITDICDSNASNTTINGDTAFPDGGNCKINDDGKGNLIVWTKHFTTFITYIQTAIPAPVSSGGGGGGGYYYVAPTPAATTTPTTTPVTIAPQGQILGTAAIKDGTLVLDGSVIYLISKGQKRPFVSAAEFLSYGFKFSDAITSDAIKDIPEGPVMRAMDGMLVLDTSGKGTIYLIGAGGIKRGFVSAKVFKDLGYKFSQARKINLADYQAGPFISSSSDPHPDGALVLGNKTVWWINNGQRHGFPSLDVFNSYGLAFSLVVKANTSDVNLPESTTVQSRDQALTTDSMFP